MIDPDCELNELDEAAELRARRESLQLEAHELLCLEVRRARERGEFLELWPAMPSTVGVP